MSYQCTQANDDLMKTHHVDTKTHERPLGVTQWCGDMVSKTKTQEHQVQVKRMNQRMNNIISTDQTGNASEHYAVGITVQATSLGHNPSSTKHYVAWEKGSNATQDAFECSSSFYDQHMIPYISIRGLFLHLMKHAGLSKQYKEFWDAYHSCFHCA